MRFVIYDDESLEAITVVNLPLTEREALERRVWRIRVPEPFRITDRPPANPAEYIRMKTVDVEFEPLVRHNGRHGEQRSVIAYTRAADLAMLLNPAWLPGQVSAVRYLEDQNDALTRLLMRAI